MRPIRRPIQVLLPNTCTCNAVTVTIIPSSYRVQVFSNYNRNAQPLYLIFQEVRALAELKSLKSTLETYQVPSVVSDGGILLLSSRLAE